MVFRLSFLFFLLFPPPPDILNNRLLIGEDCIKKVEVLY